MLLAYQGIYRDNLTFGHGKNRASEYEMLEENIDSDFFNENLSIGGLIIKESSNEILNFVGNTSHGSSGGMLLDENLRILGVNFGYFNDEIDTCSTNKYYKELFKFTSDEDIFMFDVQVPENQDNLNNPKYRNIAVNMDHDVIQTFLQEWVSTKQKKPQKSISPISSDIKGKPSEDNSIGFTGKFFKKQNKHNRALSKLDPIIEAEPNKVKRQNKSINPKVEDNQNVKKNIRKLRIKATEQNKGKEVTEMTYEMLCQMREQYNVGGGDVKKIKY